MKIKNNFTKKLLSVLLVIALFVSIVPTSLTVSAASSNVTFEVKSWDASSEQVSKTTNTQSATVVTSSDTFWGTEGKTTYYVVNSATTIGDATNNRALLVIYGEVHLILQADLTINLSVSGVSGSSLYIHTTANNPNAKLTMPSDRYIACGGRIEVHGGQINIPAGVEQFYVGLQAPVITTYDCTVNTSLACDRSSASATTRAINVYGTTMDFAYSSYTNSSCIGVKDSDSEYPYTIGIYNANLKLSNTQDMASTVIGGGNVTDITIKNSTVKATARADMYNSVAIGSIYTYPEGQSSSILIENSTITEAWGSRSGIGGTVSSITLKNSRVNVRAGDMEFVGKRSVVAIGSSDCQTLTIDGGYITTNTCKDTALTRWNGCGYVAKNIIIKNGAVNAYENMKSSGTVTISGGNVLGTIINSSGEAINPVNASGTALYSRTITVEGVASNATLSQVGGASYDISGTQLIGGKVGLWLPSDSVPTSLTINGSAYVGSIDSGAKATEGTFRLSHNCADNGEGRCSICTELMPPATDANGTYLIYDMDDYNYFKKLVEGTLLNNVVNQSANAKLMADINIGNNSIGTAEKPFKGTFDGNGYTLNSSSSLFRVVDGATIKNLTFTGDRSFRFKSSDGSNGRVGGNYGGLVVTATGDPVTFEKCMIKASYKISYSTSSKSIYEVNFGALVGYSDTDVTVNNCAYIGKMTADSADDFSCMVGKCASSATVTISNSYAYVDFDLTAHYHYIHAFSHDDNTGSINNCYYYGPNTTRYSGGVMGGTGATDSTAAKFANGTVTYQLNGGNSNGVWKQTIEGETPDELPNFTGKNFNYNLETGSYDNHDHKPVYELKTVTRANDTLHVSCANCSSTGKDVTLSINPEYFYDGSRITARVSNNVLVPIITYKKGSERLSNAPWEVGSYTASFTLDGHTVSLDFTISPVDIAGGTVTLGNSLVYNGKEQTQSFFFRAGGEWLSRGTDYTVSGNKQTKAGTYTMTITGKGGYIGTKSVEYTIAQASNSWVTPPSIDSWTYGETASTPVSKTQFGEAVVTYEGTQNGSSNKTYGTTQPENAGTYKAKFSVSETNDYAGLPEESVEFTINRATPTVDMFTFSAPDTKYDGKAKSAKVQAISTITGMGDIEVKYYAISTVDGDAVETPLDAAPTLAGTYKVKINVKEGNNYTAANDLTDDSWIFTVVDQMAPEGKIEIKNGFWTTLFDWITFDMFSKDTVDVTITADGTGTDVAKVEYLLSAEQLAENNLPTEGWTVLTENNGEYKFSIAPRNKGAVYARITDEGGNVTVINSAGIVVYDDSAHDMESISTSYKAGTDKEVTVKLNDNTVSSVMNGTTLLVPSKDYTVTGNTITLKAAYLDTLNAGGYSFTVSYAPLGEEYKETEGNDKPDTTVFRLTVDTATLTVTAEDKDVTYGDKAPNYTVTYEGFKYGDGVDDLGGTLTFDCDYAQFSDKGEYTIKASGYASNNYTINYADGKLNVSAKPITITIQNATSIYGDEIATLTATDNNNGIVNDDKDVYKLTTTAGKTAGVGRYDIIGEALDGNYSINFEKGTDAYEITTRELTVSVVVANKKYDGLNTAAITSAVLNNVANNDAVALVNGTATFTTVNVADGIAISLTDFALSGEADVLKNYTLTQPTGIKANITNDWIPTEYVVSTPNSNGWLNADLVITAKDGYELSLTNTANGVWSETLIGAVEGEDSSVTFYVRNKADRTISLAKTENYKLDKNTEATTTTGKVEFVERNSWQEFVNNITFGLFFKDEVTVKAEATDALSEIESIEYAVSDKALTLDEVKEITEWTEMPENGVGVTVEDKKLFVYFIRITDKAGNVTYLSTNGAEYDLAVPVISGIENGSTYYTTQVVTVEDKNLASVELDGETITLDNGTLTLAGNVDATYTIKVTDKAGNITEYTVTMKTIAELTKSLDDITVDDVTSDDKETIQQVIVDIDEQLENDDLTEEEKAALEETKDKSQDLLDKLDEAANADDTDNTEKVKDITADNVTPEDKSDLEKAKEDLTKTLDDYSDNLTEDEKKAIEDEIKRIDDALEIVESIETVEEVIGKLPENITKADETAINDAKKAYDDLSDYEKGLVDDEVKEKLDKAIADLVELNKPVDTTSPTTFDNTNLWLWFALLFVSGGISYAAAKKAKRLSK